VAGVAHLVIGTLEWNRYRNFLEKKETGLIGAPFDPLNLRNDYRRQSEVCLYSRFMTCPVRDPSDDLPSGSNPFDPFNLRTDSRQSEARPFRCFIPVGIVIYKDKYSLSTSRRVVSVQ
jgi:hypothetical protein